ncbi:MAG: hypothetical protein IKM23_09250 [Bacteroidales bacterium]|nr:hypothetical protein [Bacteroidales bacterium]
MRLFWVGLILIMFFSSCQEKKTDKGEIIVSVYGKNLYKTDLDDIFYEGISYSDSVLRSKVYIDRWIQEQLIVHQAENNLEPEQLDFSQRLEEYRTSLIINKYETELISQNLNNEITEEQILEYYDKNSDEFRLNRDIARVVSVTIDKDHKQRWNIMNLLRDHDSVMVDSITYMAEKYAVTYDMNIEEWRNINDIVEQYNLKVKDNKAFLNKNRFMIVYDDYHTTYIRFCECRFISDLTPCELETERIKYIILNNRKKELLDQLYDDLYSNALQDKAIEIY